MDVPTFQLCTAGELSKELICELMKDMESDQHKIDQIDTVIDSIIKSGVRFVDSEDFYSPYDEEIDLDVLVKVEYLDYFSNLLKLSVTFRMGSDRGFHLCISNGIPTVNIYMNNVFHDKFILSEECFVKIMLSSAMVYLVFTSFYPSLTEEDDNHLYLDLMENHFCFYTYVNEILSYRNRRRTELIKSAKSARFTPY